MSEYRTILSSFEWTQYRNLTDRQTESIWLLQRSALRAMRTRCKKLENMTIANALQLEATCATLVLFHF